MPAGQHATAVAPADPGLGLADPPPVPADLALGLAERGPAAGLPEPAPATCAGRIPHAAMTTAIAPTAVPRHRAAAAVPAVMRMLCILRSVSWRHFAVNRGRFGRAGTHFSGQK